jgi:hypothetical protein
VRAAALSIEEGKKSDREERAHYHPGLHLRVADGGTTEALLLHLLQVAGDGGFVTLPLSLQ